MAENKEHTNIDSNNAQDSLAAVNESPPWGRSVKVIVGVSALLLLLWLGFRFQSLIGQIVAAIIIAYILNPLINLIDRNTAFKRSSGILIVYLVLGLSIIGAIIALGFAAVEQISSLIQEIPTFITETAVLIQSTIAGLEPISIGPFTIDLTTFDWTIISDQLVGLVEPILGRSGEIVTSIATTTVSFLTILLFVFVLSVYFAIEIPELGSYISRVAYQPGYQKDAERLTRESGRIWSAYLRGQVILGLVIFLVVWIGLAILGVRNSLALGILSGLLEFIPVIGPVVGAGTAMVVAFFQPDNYMGLSSLTHTGIVLAFMIVVQQVENNLLVPRIVGDALDLHPLVVMVGVFMGSSLAGILGAVLAAPVIATIKLLGIYGWRKMFDLPPFAVPELEQPPPSPTLRERVSQIASKITPKPKN